MSFGDPNEPVMLAFVVVVRAEEGGELLITLGDAPGSEMLTRMLGISAAQSPPTTLRVQPPDTVVFRHEIHIAPDAVAAILDARERAGS